MIELRSPINAGDICLLSQTLKICAVFLIVPFCFLTNYLKLIYCWYLISAIIHFHGMYKIWVFAYQYLENTKSTVDIILTVFDLVAYIFFIIVGFLDVFKKKKAVEELLQNFKNFDLSIDTCYFQETSSIYVRLWLYHGIPIFILVNKFLNNTFTNETIFGSFLISIYIFVLVYMKFLLMMIITVLAMVFTSRYNAFEHQLRKFFCSLRVLIENKKYKEIDELRKSFFLLQRNTKMIDDIFGLAIFSVFMNACSGLFSSFSYILLLKTAANLESYWITIQQFAEAGVS